MQLFFDFDGTLADSSPGIYASFQLACNSLDLLPPAYNVFRDAIGPPVQLLARQFFPELKEQEVDVFRQTFRHDYDSGRFRQCHWYKGVMFTIRALAESGENRLAVITNKPTGPTLELLREGGLSDFFELVVGIDYQVIHGTGPVFSCKADAIKLAHYQLPQSNLGGIYIGDTPSDRMASLACGFKFIAATYGFHRWLDGELGASDRISNPSDLILLLLSPRRAPWAG
jgi:phosphoglycolate phosphatase